MERAVLARAIEKFAAAGEEAGFSVEQMIQILNAGVGVESPAGHHRAYACGEAQFPMWFLALDHVTMKNDARWTTIKAELQRETEAIFHRSGEVLLIDSVEKSDFELTVTSETGQLKITYVPERNAVRWETEKEYGLSGYPHRTRIWQKA